MNIKEFAKEKGAITAPGKYVLSPADGEESFRVYPCKEDYDYKNPYDVIGENENPKPHNISYKQGIGTYAKIGKSAVGKILPICVVMGNSKLNAFIKEEDFKKINITRFMGEDTVGFW